MPLTAAGGVMAYDSVRPRPIFCAPSSSKSAPFSEWSGQAGVVLGDELLARELRARFVPLAPSQLVHELGERLGEPVGERLDHDRAVVVVLGIETAGDLVRSEDAHRERADLIS